MSRSDITATNGATVLGGSLWVPDGRAPTSLIVMHPGSGPSDRDNDVFFPPIRQALVDSGVAVASFDKRGVGSSGGSWLEAGIIDQAADLYAGVQVARTLVPKGIPVGLFGHSQGGWVVLEAAASTAANFVITSSGPAVTPRLQEEFSAGRGLARLDVSGAQVSDALRLLEELFDRLSAEDSYEHASEWMNDPQRSDSFTILESAGAFIPRSADLWGLARLIIDHDPATALAALRVPLLAILGSADNVVPVDACARVFRDLVQPELLTLRVMEGGNHRMRRAGSGDFVPEYLPTLVNFVSTHSTTMQNPTRT